MNTKTIIVATDFSEGARHATEWALQFAIRFKSKLALYHCYHVPVVTSDMPLPAGNEIMIEEALLKLMEDEKKRLQKIDSAVEIITMVEPGFANESIEHYAQNIDADLIITGISGKSFFEKNFVGSTAHHLALKSQKPVVVVPTENTGLTLKNVVLAIDQELNVADYHLIQFLNFLAEVDCSVDVVHVKTGKVDNSKNIHTAAQFIANHYKSLKTVTHILDGHTVEESLKNFISNNNSSLLITLHKNRGFFNRLFHKSHSGKMIYEMNIPVMVLHEN